jgi:hypothetical protein
MSVSAEFLHSVAYVTAIAAECDNKREYKNPDWSMPDASQDDHHEQSTKDQTDSHDDSLFHPLIILRIAAWK